MTSSRGSGRTPFASRLFAYYSVLILAILVVTGWIVVQSAQGAFEEEMFEALEDEANRSAPTMPSDPSDLPGWVDERFQATGDRFTVIDEAGVVLADSHADPAVMENHADRPEVAAALDGEVGTDVRSSESTGFAQLYVAIPTEPDRVLRVSAPQRDLAVVVAPVRNAVIGIFAAAAAVGLVVSVWAARRLARPIVDLAAQTSAIARGESRRASRSPIREIDEIGMATTELEDGNLSRLAEAGRASATLEVVLGALPQGTVLFDQSDEVVYSNPSARELLGSVPDNLAGLAPFAFQAAVRESRETRAPVSGLTEHGKPVRQLRGVATPFAEDERVLLVVVDVTDRERAASVRRDFVANASHELKTPVSAIIASSEALKMAVERGDDSAIRFARQIDESAHQLDRMVTDLLDLSRLERDQPELDPLSLDLLLREEVERIRSVAEDNDIVVSCHATPVRVAGSRRDVAIAIRNLLDNAVRYTGAGGSIGAELSATNGEAVLRIRDTGDGIPTRDLSRVFERFYRVDSARSRATGGTGLGLAIVKHVVESHGGSVDVESQLGVGSTFTVHLPVLGDDNPGAGLA